MLYGARHVNHSGNNIRYRKGRCICVGDIWICVATAYLSPLSTHLPWACSSFSLKSPATMPRAHAANRGLPACRACHGAESSFQWQNRFGTSIPQSPLFSGGTTLWCALHCLPETLSRPCPINLMNAPCVIFHPFPVSHIPDPSSITSQTKFFYLKWYPHYKCAPGEMKPMTIYGCFCVSKGIILHLEINKS